MTSGESSPTVRPDPPMIGTDHKTLRGWLDYHRATLQWKCDGLGDEQLRTSPVRSSSLSLLGLVRHMAEVERHWFRRVIGGETIRHVWSEAWDFQAAYDASGSTRAEAFGAWQLEIDRSRSIAASIRSLDKAVHVDSWDTSASLRTILLHVIHEYARHNGHADILREAIDGSVGA